MRDTARPPIDSSLLTDLSLARGVLTRSDRMRADVDWWVRRRADPATRVLVVRDGLAPIRGGAPPRLHAMAPAQAPEGERILLGDDGEGHPWVMVRPAGGPAADEADGPAWVSLREIGADLPDDEAAVLVTAVALDHWHATHARCPRCGAETSLTQAGWVRRCVADGTEHYPRTDPAVIVLVIDDADRALLGRQGRWPAGWFSTLAGFVEPGESAEDAVRREVAEESGVRVGEVTYLGSQPWPFPRSLMLGYHARAIDVEVEVDGVEIAEARWFSRGELADACRAGRVALPPRVSIARRLVERWFGDAIPGDWSMLREGPAHAPR